MIIPLSELTKAPLYGSKAARLSICLRTGLPVPAGITLHPDLVAGIAQGTLADGEQAMLERLCWLLGSSVQKFGIFSGMISLSDQTSL